MEEHLVSLGRFQASASALAGSIDHARRSRSAWGQRIEELERVHSPRILVIASQSGEEPRDISLRLLGREPGHLKADTHEERVARASVSVAETTTTSASQSGEEAANSDSGTGDLVLSDYSCSLAMTELGCSAKSLQMLDRVLRRAARPAAQPDAQKHSASASRADASGDPWVLLSRKEPTSIAHVSEETDLALPGARVLHACVRHEDTLYVVGGAAGPGAEQAPAVLRALVPSSSDADGAGAWHALPTTQESKGVPPSTLEGHSCVVSQGQQLLVFGGRVRRVVLNELHVLDLATARWQPNSVVSGPVPAPRYQHAACMHESLMFVFGGGVMRDGKMRVAYADLHAFDPTKREWAAFRDHAGVAPPPRGAHSMLSAGGHLWVFGGRDGQRRWGDMWRGSVDIASRTVRWTEVRAKGAPPPRAAHAASASADGGALVVLGGRAQRGFAADVHVFDVRRSRWIRMSCAGSAFAPRAFHSACWLDEETLVVLGGCDDARDFTSALLVNVSSALAEVHQSQQSASPSSESREGKQNVNHSPTGAAEPPKEDVARMCQTTEQRLLDDTTCAVVVCVGEKAHASLAKSLQSSARVICGGRADVFCVDKDGVKAIAAHVATAAIKWTALRFRDRVRAVASAIAVDSESALTELVPEGDGAQSQSSVLSILWTFAEGIRGSLDGSFAPSISSASGGARIASVFHDVFEPRLRRLAQPERGGEEETAEIRNAIRNAEGVRPSVFLPQSPFETIVRRRIESLRAVCEHCSELVHAELLTIGRECAAAHARRYPKMAEALVDALQVSVRSLLEPTNEYVARVRAAIRRPLAPLAPEILQNLYDQLWCDRARYPLGAVRALSAAIV